MYGSLWRRTKHVIFLDTPHAGIDPVAWESISKGSFNEKNKEQWSLGSKDLEDLSKAFAAIAGTFNITAARVTLAGGPLNEVRQIMPEVFLYFVVDN